MPHSSSESEDGECHSDEDPLPGPKPAKSAGALWGEIAAAQVLEEGILGNNLAQDGQFLSRGAESYAIPELATFDEPEAPPVEAKSDLFATTSESVEAFGVKRNPRKRRMEETPEPTSNGSSRPSSRGSHKGKLNKRSKTGGVAMPFMDKGFSYESMYRAEVPNGLDAKGTAEFVANTFGEVDMRPIVNATELLGVPVVVDLFKQTIVVEKNGGLTVENGTRRRTPGGVFFKLLKDSEQIEKSAKNKISEFGRKIMQERQNHKAQSQKAKLKSAEQALKSLPDAKDALLACSSTDSATRADPAPKLDLKAEIQNLMDLDAD